MKKIFLALFAIALLCVLQSRAQAQRIGFSAGFGTSSSMLLDIFYLENGEEYHLGFSYQFADTRGKLVEDQEANFSRTVENTGEFYRMVDLGYGYRLGNNMTVQGELSVGTRKEFTNYLDVTFTGGGYHMIDESSIILGGGANIGYNFTESITVFMGYNTLREFTFGVKFDFPFSRKESGEEE